MNKELFINGFKKRIKEKFNLTDACAFEILVLAAFLDLSFDEVMANVSKSSQNSHKFINS
jgi:hypothetical protein